MTNYTNRWIKKKLSLLRTAFRDRCFLCDKNKDLHFAHIRPTDLSGRGRGRKERYYDVKNNPASYMLVCKTCHRTHDSINKGVIA